MKQNKTVKYIKILVAVLAASLFIGLVVYLLPTIKGISTPEGQVAFKEKIQNMGIWGFFLLFGLQIAQIMLIILPGEPLEILAGMCYGTWGGTAFIFISVFITTSLIIYLVRKYGKKYLYQFFKKEKIDKIENSRFFKDNRKVELIVCILFLVPGTPKDLLVYLGGLLPIKPMRFILISTFIRFPSVISSTIAGENIVDGNWKMLLFVYLVTFLITGIVLLVVHHFDKDKVTSEAIRSLK